MSGIENRSPLHVPGVYNMRDAGGHSCAGGRVRTGMLVRSSEWTFLQPGGAGALADLQLDVVADLRTPAERAWRPDPDVPGVSRLVVDVVGHDRTLSKLAMVLLEVAAGADEDSFGREPLLSDPEAARAALADGRSREAFIRGYRNFCDGAAARSGLGRVVHRLADGDRMAVHCAAGKDRTGWAVATVLMYLGVAWEDVVEDYVRSNALLGEAIDALLARAEAAGGDPDLLEPMLVVREEYLDAFRARMEQAYGSIHGYVEGGLGLGAEGGARLRRSLVVQD